MGFFETSDGFAHVGRIAGVFYLLALVPGCEWFYRVDALCAMRIVSTVGWWLAFGVGKRRMLKLSDLVAGPVSLLGLLTLTIGVVGQFYFVGTR
jgi:hypothetical protein